MTKPTLIVLQHVEMEGPQRIGELAAARGWNLDIRRLDIDAAPPKRLLAGEILCVMGGPMGVGDLDDARYPFLKPEVELLKGVLERRQPVIGICLGSQLLAHAAGAQVGPLLVGEPPVRHREVGWGAIHRVTDDPVFAGMDESEVVLHWHGDTFSLPPGGTLCASSLACPHQMFHLDRRAWGLQFHIEVTLPSINRWVEEDAAYVRAANGPGGAARIRADSAWFIDRHRQVGDRLINNILDALAAAL
jgi:GMP synthase (glutamine-hydrolysing)